MRKAIAFLLMMFLTIASFSVLNAADKDKSLEFDADVVLSSVMTLADNYINSIAVVLELAAVTEEVASLDWQRIKPLLAKIEGRKPGEVIAWYAKPDGTYYTVDDGLTEENQKDRSYFPKVLAGFTSVGEVVASKSTGQVSTIIAVPIKKNGTVAGILGVSLFTKTLSVQIKTSLGFKNDDIFFALNKDHITVLNIRPQLVFLDPEKQDSPSMTKAVKEMMSKDQGTLEYDFHGKRRVIFRKSPYTNWWYAAGKVIR